MTLEQRVEKLEKTVKPNKVTLVNEINPSLKVSIELLSDGNLVIKKTTTTTTEVETPFLVFED